MYLDSDPSKTWIIDIETDGLKPTKIWCIVVKNLQTKVTRVFDVHSDNISSFKFWLASLPSQVVFVGHNALSFDIPWLNRLLGTSIPLSNVIDTLVMSYLYYPAIEGGHSLEAYGNRFGTPKKDHSEWNKYSPEMLERCKGDVEITERVYLNLVRKLKERGFSERSCKLEHDIRRIVDVQERNGFCFNIDEATNLYRRLRVDQESLGEDIKRLFPASLVSVGRYAYRTRQDGEPFASYTRHCIQYPKVIRHGDDYEVFDWREFNIASPAQRLSKLLERGYTPSKLTKSGNLAADEEVLLDASEVLSVPEIKAMADWLVLQGRISMLKGDGIKTRGWIDYYNPETGAIHGKIMTCGAGSRRMIHNSPNTANVPTAEEKIKYGRECRNLWTSRPNRVLVGYDARNLEGCMFVHFLGNKVTKEVYNRFIHEDAHAFHANVFGIRRSPAKNVFYAFIYGAQDTRLGVTAEGKDRNFGARIRKTLFDITPGLEDAVKSSQDEYHGNEGFLECPDGGYVRCPSPHAALNYKCQPAGAIVMKQASIFLDEEANRLGFDHLKVGDIHDEGQHDLDPKDAKEFGRTAVRCIKRAGEELNIKVPLDGAYKIGRTWAETH